MGSAAVCNTCGDVFVSQPKKLTRMNSNITDVEYKELNIANDPLFKEINKKQFQIGQYFLEKKILRDKKRSIQE